jgi:hypothetical protein
MNVGTETIQPDLIRQIAEAIFYDQFAANWRFYALVGGITLLVNVASNLLISYLKKRGETLATKADMDEILRQLSQTTRVAEEVKSRVSEAEWVSREWRTVRRTKLEELIATAYLHEEWINKHIAKWVDGKIDNDPGLGPSSKMQLLSALYFPNLNTEVATVRKSYLNLLTYIIDASAQVRDARRAGTGYLDAHNKYLDGYKPLYGNAIASVSALEIKSAEVMATFANP